MAHSIENGMVERAKAQFDAAFSRLEVAQHHLQSLASQSGNDDATLRTARLAYDHARLFWLSSEAALRSAAITQNRQYHPVRRVVILQGNSHVAESIALLLRLRGFKTTVVSRHPLDGDRPVQPGATVIADFERKPEHADELALNRFRTTVSTRFVAMIPPALSNHDWNAFDAVVLKPATIDTIIQVILADSHG